MNLVSACPKPQTMIPRASHLHYKLIPIAMPLPNLVHNLVISKMPQIHHFSCQNTKSQDLHQNCQTSPPTLHKWLMRFASNLTLPHICPILKSTLETYHFPSLICYHKTKSPIKLPHDPKQIKTVISCP